MGRDSEPPKPVIFCLTFQNVLPNVKKTGVTELKNFLVLPNPGPLQLTVNEINVDEVTDKGKGTSYEKPIMSIMDMPLTLEHDGFSSVSFKLVTEKLPI